VSIMNEKKIPGKFMIQLVLAKLEHDGESMATFRFLDHEEIVEFPKLEDKLLKYYKTGLAKIKEIKEEFTITS